MVHVFNCRRGRFWWRRKCRAKYRGPWWRWPAVSITVTYAPVHDWVSVDSDDTQWSDATLCHAIQHGHLVEVEKLCYSSDSTLYNKMPVGKLKSRNSEWFCHDTCSVLIILRCLTRLWFVSQHLKRCNTTAEFPLTFW
jgi:hypothetical protein